MAFRKIDMEKYPRRRHFEYFRTLQYPYVGVTQAVDVTALVNRCRSQRISFYLTFLHAAALAADGIPEFRQRIRDGGIIEYDECPTSHIELLEDGTYVYCTLRHHMPMEAYLPYALEMRQQCRQSGGLEEDEDVERMYFISTVPWLHYTALIQPVAGGDESNPRITWGRYQADPDGHLQMPVTVLAHHGLVDGVHIAGFYRNLDLRLAQLDG